MYAKNVLNVLLTCVITVLGPRDEHLSMKASIAVVFPRFFESIRDSLG